jgi:hypothetical protein
MLDSDRLFVMLIVTDGVFYRLNYMCIYLPPHTGFMPL